MKNIKVININKNDATICFCNYDNEFRLSDMQVKDVKDITKCDIYADKNIIQTTNRGSQIAGAIIGGVIFGPVGAVVGGVTGKKTSRIENKSYEIKIYYSIPESPIDIIKLNYEDVALHFYATLESLINLDKQKEQVTSTCVLSGN